jgi:hypothetical protein
MFLVLNFYFISETQNFGPQLAKITKQISGRFAEKFP